MSMFFRNSASVRIPVSLRARPNGGVRRALFKVCTGAHSSRHCDYPGLAAHSDLRGHGLTQAPGSMQPRHRQHAKRQRAQRQQ